MKKKVLILTGDAGFGHRSAANSIAATLAKRDEIEFEVRIENLLDMPDTPTALRNTQTDYDKIVTEMPKLYEFSYESSDRLLPTQIAQIGLSAMLYTPFLKVMKSYDPDIIVNTYPLYHGPAQTWYLINEESWNNERKKRKAASDLTPLDRKHKPFITVITDLVSVHMIWMSLMPDYYCVATNEMKEQTAKYGVSRDKIFCTGIPVKPVFYEEQRSKHELKSSLGWDPEKTTILSVGSKRVSNLMDYLDILNHSDFDIQLILIAGGDDELYEKMKAVDWHIPVKIYNFTKELPMMMLASDLIITKAGGLITSESMAAGLPMILIDVLPGQEEGNAQYIVDNQAGALLRNPTELIFTLKHWLMDDKIGLKSISERVKLIGKPKSSLEISDIIIKELIQ